MKWIPKPHEDAELDGEDTARRLRAIILRSKYNVISDWFDHWGISQRPCRRPFFSGMRGD